MNAKRYTRKAADRTASAPSDPRRWRPGTSLQIGPGGATNMKLEELHAADIRCIELAWRNDEFDIFDSANERMLGRLAARARELGIEIWSLHLPYGEAWDVSVIHSGDRDAAISRHLRLLGMADRWNIRTTVLHPSWEPIPQAERQQRLSACQQSLALLSESSSRLGVRIAVECLPRTCLGHTSEEMAVLLEADERLGVCCDVNHLTRETPARFIQALGSRLFTVHMSDNDGIDERHWLPGQGVIRWNDVIGALADRGYDGPFMFEARPVQPSRLADCWRELLTDYVCDQRERKEEGS
ncbi:hypothetical protein B1A99_11840 [Cohnella sp. CIP 111063]|uniref:sugar phosphate isomerase/epimerase family protein n=1 Tax=unclassified Cohnella TaxID=2636738 RepID=UPI000B8BDD90|nr:MULTISPECIES: sugar phosphate isomerase/epimerase family protein [unclassified Cohnella]OXS59307.1 hypothetical protein B1A99_11840 [Cohnella sp. CIP 111063]PRX72331.1 sugar phosphate isomerase/epimerase [Cohnella sp. SGD-V74]